MADAAHGWRRANDAMSNEESRKSGGQPQPSERLQKIIAAAGIASRRKAEELITAGRVQVNGQMVTELGTKADPERDHIRVDGKLLQGPEQHRYLMLNKPKGYVTTVSDPEEAADGDEVFRARRRAGVSCGPAGLPERRPAADDQRRRAGQPADQGGVKVEKTYLVKVSGKPTEAALEQLRRGIMIERGKPGIRARAA